MGIRPFRRFLLPGAVLGALAAAVLFGIAQTTAEMAETLAISPVSRSPIWSPGSESGPGALRPKLNLYTSEKWPLFTDPTDTFLGSEYTQSPRFRRFRARRERLSRSEKVGQLAASLGEASALYDWDHDLLDWRLWERGDTGFSHSNLRDLIKEGRLGIRYYPFDENYSDLHIRRERNDSVYFDLEGGRNEFKLILKLRN